MGHQRGKHVSHPRTSLIKIDNVDSPQDAQFYLGKVSVEAETAGSGIGKSRRGDRGIGDDEGRRGGIIGSRRIIMQRRDEGADIGGSA